MATREKGDDGFLEEDESPIEQVALTVDAHDDPTLPVWTFRMWTLGILSCAVLAFVNTFFYYRASPLIVSALSAQIIAMPLGKFMANVLPSSRFPVRIPYTDFTFCLLPFSLNPGPFNKKEHVLITIFANAGFSFNNGPAYAVGIVDIIKVFYKRKVTFSFGLLLIITTQVLGYGWAGLLRKYLVEPASMWWPGNMVQVSIFNTLHEEETKKKGLSRLKFFLIFLIVSFSYSLLPAYLFPVLAYMSWVCWCFPKSVLAQQLGSGKSGLGLGAFSLDWATTTAYLASPLVPPFHVIMNIAFGFFVTTYVIMAPLYFGNIYNAKTFPFLSSDLYNSTGQVYDINSIVNDKFELDNAAYEKHGNIHLSTFFAITYGLGFASLTGTLSHVICFHGKEIWSKFRSSRSEKPDVHLRMMRKYPDIPAWWFWILVAVALAVTLVTCFVYKHEIQLPWWGVLLAAVLAAVYTLPVGVIAATTNQVPGINVLTELFIGYILPGKPIANVCFKTYGYISMSQAVSFLQDFKLGHYMKVPPRSMFIVQIIGTILAGVVNLGCAWWLLTSIDHICDTQLLPGNSPWTCVNDNVFYDASVIWGLIGPKRIFANLGEYKQMYWFFLVGAILPVLVWICHRLFPNIKWIHLINLPVILTASAYMPPAAPIHFTTWIILGTFFNYFVFKYRKNWWQRYNYLLSASLDAGVAFVTIVTYLTLGFENKNITWWGSGDTSIDRCPLAQCPTAKGIVVDGCPVF